MESHEKLVGDYLRALTGGIVPALKGTHCSYCGQFVKLYRRPITFAAAVTLVYMHRQARAAGRAEFLYLERFMKTSWAKYKRGDETKLAHWGLIEAMPNEKSETNHRNGYWRITDKGMRFVVGKSLPKYVYLYNNKVVGFSDGEIFPRADATIGDALNTPFDYDKLMSSEWTPPGQTDLKL